MRRLLCVMGMAACGLCACLSPTLVAPGDESAVGLFTEDKLVVAPQPGIGRERATIRSRIVQIDTKQITAARRGRGTLRLNLFDDLVLDVRVEHVRPTRSGHYLSGRPVDGGWGEVSLVMNGSIVVGEVTTREGTYTIRPGRSGRHVIRQIDPSPSLPDDYRKIAPPDNTPHASSRERTQENLLRDSQTRRVMDDGTQIDVLVVYTPGCAKRTRRNGRNRHADRPLGRCRQRSPGKQRCDSANQSRAHRADKLCRRKHYGIAGTHGSPFPPGMMAIWTKCMSCATSTQRTW